MVLCSKLEENLRSMVRCSFEVYRRRGLKVNAGKSKVMILAGEKGLEFECEVCAKGIKLEHFSEFKYFG